MKHFFHASKRQQENYVFISTKSHQKSLDIDLICFISQSQMDISVKHKNEIKTGHGHRELGECIAGNWESV